MKKIFLMLFFSLCSVVMTNSYAYDCSAAVRYIDGGFYATGAIVSNDNIAYLCFNEELCQAGGDEYAPGAGQAWPSAWDFLGPCDTDGSSSGSGSSGGSSNGGSSSGGSSSGGSSGGSGSSGGNPVFYGHVVHATRVLALGMKMSINASFRGSGAPLTQEPNSTVTVGGVPAIYDRTNTQQGMYEGGYLIESTDSYFWVADRLGAHDVVATFHAGTSDEVTKITSVEVYDEIPELTLEVSHPSSVTYNDTVIFNVRYDSYYPSPVAYVSVDGKRAELIGSEVSGGSDGLPYAHVDQYAWQATHVGLRKVKVSLATGTLDPTVLWKESELKIIDDGTAPFVFSLEYKTPVVFGDPVLVDLHATARNPQDVQRGFYFRARFGTTAIYNGSSSSGGGTHYELHAQYKLNVERKGIYYFSAALQTVTHTTLYERGKIDVIESGSCPDIPFYASGITYSTGTVVQNEGKTYKCNVGDWCSIGHAYEPGNGWVWTQAWTEVGECVDPCKWLIPWNQSLPWYLHNVGDRRGRAGHIYMCHTQEWCYLDPANPQYGSNGWENAGECRA